MMSRLVVALSAGIATLLLGAQPAFACDCYRGAPACEAFWKTPVIFAGVVEAVTKLPRQNDSGPTVKYRFKVTEALRGTTAREIELFGYGTNCDLFFEPGQAWLIYASPLHGRPGLGTSNCSRSRQLSSAKEDLEYARSVHAKPWSDKGRIFGQVMYRQQISVLPASGVQLTFNGPGSGPVTTKTDRDGRYEVLVPAGTYRVATKPPPGMSLDEFFAELIDGRGCAKVDTLGDYPGQLAGQVVDATGAPVPNLTIEMITVEGWEYPPSRTRAVTDAAGRFTANLMPGNYRAAVTTGDEPDTIGVRPRHEPLREEAMTVQGGSTLAVGVLVLPPTLRVAQVSGVVLHADGRPAANVKVRTKADFDRDVFPWTTIRSDARGRFRFGLVVSTRHRIVAESDTQGRAATVVDPSRPVRELRLVLR